MTRRVQKFSGRECKVSVAEGNVSFADLTEKIVINKLEEEDKCVSDY